MNEPGYGSELGEWANVLPDARAGRRVNCRDGIVRVDQIHDSVVDERRGSGSTAGGGQLARPYELELIHVLASDLIERRVVPVRHVPAEHHPVGGFRVVQLLLAHRDEVGHLSPRPAPVHVPAEHPDHRVPPSTLRGRTRPVRHRGPAGGAPRPWVGAPP